MPAVGSGFTPGSVMPVWGRAGGVVAGSSGAATGAGVDVEGVVVVVVVEVEVVFTSASAAWTAPPVVSAAPANRSPIAYLALFMGGIVNRIVSGEQLLGNATRHSR